MYRQLNAAKGSTVYVPKSLSASPNNPIVRLFKASYNFNDPINLSSELLRSTDNVPVGYNNRGTEKLPKEPSLFVTTTDVLTNVERLFSDYIRSLNTPFDNTHSSENPYLVKSQQRPLRKGIANMLRLHATGAIAMPTELRLQILASSRDIIHS
jgi:hypothetical protein